LKIQPNLVKNLLIFHAGSLGDTLAAVPALRIVRNYFPNARSTMLLDRQGDTPILNAVDVLAGQGLIDEFISYDVDKSTLLTQLFSIIGQFKLLFQLRKRQFDLLVYLIQGHRRKTLNKHLLFFWTSGIRCWIGTKGFINLPQKKPGEALPSIPQQADQLLLRLHHDGITVPTPNKGDFLLHATDQIKLAVDRWIDTVKPDIKRRWIALGPGSKMPVKIWPQERFVEVCVDLVARHDVWPIVLGGVEDRERGEFIIRAVGRGSMAAGSLNVAEGIGLLQRCELYLGNDTGTMHMAAAAGIPCVAIFSSRDYPGNWYPYGNGHTVFRTPIECEGCMLTVCDERKMACILAISPDQVSEAVGRILKGNHSQRINEASGIQS